MNHKTPLAKPSSRSVVTRACFSLLLPALGTIVQAQTPVAADASPQDEVIQLSPFSVVGEKGTGYRASNSISGTRSNTPIKDVPLNIQVFTQDFTSDINATSQLDLERYNASLVNGGSDVHSDNAIQQAYNAFLFRGFVQNWGLRDGVRTYDPIDTVGLARIEIVKGPAAALYGVTYAGGVMNNISKEVDYTRNFTSLSASVQDEGGYRGTIDTNYSGKFGPGSFGVRVNAAHATTKDFRAHSEGMVNYTQVNLSWKPYTGTLLSFITEQGYREKPNGLSYFTAPERVNNVDLPNGASIPLQITHPEIPWSWNWANGNVRTSEITLQRGTITQTISEDFSVTAYFAASHRLNVDSEGWDNSGGGGSAASWDVGPSWRPHATYLSGWLNPNTSTETIQLGYHHRDWENTNHAYGITALYKLEFAGVKNTFTVGANAWNEHFITHMSTLPTGTTSLINYPVKANIALPTPSTAPTDLFRDPAGGYGHENNSNDYVFGSWQASMIDNRLKLNAAINRTSIKLVNWGSGTTVTPSITETKKTSPMFGAMFDITKEISIFAVHSTSLFPTTDKNDFNVTLPATVGKSMEAGIKIDLLDGKVSGTVSYYQITQTGGSQRDPNAINNNKVAWDGMNAAQRLINFPGLTREQLTDRAGQLGDLIAGAESQSKGFEADLIIQPTRQYQILFSYAHNNVEVTDAINKSIIGQTTQGSIKDQLAMMHKYTFTDGAVKGLSLGLGLQYSGKAFQDYNGPVPTVGATGSARYNPSTLYVETFAGYKFKFGGYNQRVQLNIKNLTQQADFIGWKATGSATKIATDRYEVPTRMTFTLTYGLDF